ncbi:MAG: hypothetical protein JSV04_11960, partial [Candidatus Heimdallarchaeota archaeon]
MLNRYNSSEIKITFTDSVKKVILISLAILFIISITGSYFILIPMNPEGKDLGYLLIPLIVISEIPILVNYFYLVIHKFGRISTTKNSVMTRISQIFTLYYTPALTFHSVVHTIVIGFVLSHALLVMDKTTSLHVFSVAIPYCMLFLPVLGLLWVIEFFFWCKNWPIDPKPKQRDSYLYWIYWFFFFSTSVYAIFHSGLWGQSLFLCI